VSLPDVFPELVFGGVRESSVKIEHRDQGDLLGSRQFAPDQEAVRRIEIQAPARIRLDDRQRIIAEELIEIVEISISSRSHIRGVHSMAAYLIRSRDLKLAVRIASCVGDSQEGAGWIHHETIPRAALLITHPERQVFEQPTVELDIPSTTAWISDLPDDCVRERSRGQ